MNTIDHDELSIQKHIRKNLIHSKSIREKNPNIQKNIRKNLIHSNTRVRNSNNKHKRTQAASELKQKAASSK